MGWAAEFVDELSEFDRRMNKAVTDSGILIHVPRHALFKAGGHAEAPQLPPAFSFIKSCTQAASACSLCAELLSVNEQHRCKLGSICRGMSSQF